MSKQLLDRVAQELAVALEEAPEVRKSLNLLEHTTTISRGALYQAVFQELNFKTSKGEDRFPGWTLLPEEKKEEIAELVKDGLTDAMHEIHSTALDAQKEVVGTEASLIVWPKQFTEKSPYIRLTALYPEGSNIEFTFKRRGTEISQDLTSFSAVREIYAETVKKIFSKINTIIAEYKQTLKNRDPSVMTEDESKFSKQRFTKNPLKLGSTMGAKVALEHLEGTTVNEVVVSRADAQLQELMSTSELSPRQTKSLLKEFGLEIFLEYSSEIDATKMKVKVGSYKKNASKSSEERKGLVARKQIIKTLKSRLDNLDLGEFGGSDTRVEIEKKKIVKKFKDSIDEGVKVKTIDTEIKTSKRSVTKKIKGKTTKSSSKGKFKGGAKKKYPNLTTPGRRSNITLSSLVPAINAKLKQTVLKNMQAPGLQNRTGRFASSVRATDVVSTKQGYPSIGYTYQKNPYQVFEDGAGTPPWANGNRDPRDLIDKSIREIAQDLIIGRFYTRRI